MEHVFHTPYTGPVSLRITTAESPARTAVATTQADVRPATTLSALGPAAANMRTPLKVQARVADARNRPLGNVEVNFLAPGVGSCSARSNPGGVAACHIDRALLTAGDHLVEVTVSPPGMASAFAITTVRVKG